MSSSSDDGGRLEPAALRPVDVPPIWVGGPVLIAIALGVTAWGLLHRDQLAVLSRNQLDAAQRAEGLEYLTVAAVAVVSIYAGAVLLRRVWTHTWQLADTAKRLNRLLACCLAGPFVVALFTPRIETQEAAVTLVLIACASLLCVPTIIALVPASPTRLPSPFGWGRPGDRWARVVALLALMAAWIGYSYFFSRLAITNHHGLHMRTVDLGIYDNIFYQSIHGNPLGCSVVSGGNHISAHFDPILVVLSPLYLIYPRAELLLVLQSIWVGGGVVPVYLIARRRLRSHLAGVLLALAYAAHPAVHGANMYEFHSLTLLGTPLLWGLYFLERGSGWGYFPLLVIILSVREDAALLMGFVGGYAILSGHAAKVRMGWITIGVSIAFFYFVKAHVMTSADLFNTGAGSLSFSYYYRELTPPGEGFAGFLTSVAVNPMYAIKIAVKEAKLVYLATVLLPVAMLPIVAKPGRLMMLYALAFIMLASKYAVYSTHFQYSMLLVPILFALAPAAMAQLENGGGRLVRRLGRRRLRGAVLGCMVVAGTLTSWKFGGLVENASFRGGYKTVVRELTEPMRERYAKVRELAAMIPPDAKVSASGRVGAHVSNRMTIYRARHRKKDAEYLFVDERELESGLKNWYERQKSAGELEEIASYQSIKLYKVVPQATQ